MVELKDAKCPGCGGELKLNPALEKGICIFCGKEIIVADAIQRAIVDGLQTSDAAITRAYQKLEDGDPDGAMADFKHVINLKPTYSEAHYGCFVCALFEAEYYRKLNRRLQRNLYDYVENLNNAVSTYGKRALQYASSEAERSKYQKQIDLAISQAEIASKHIEYEQYHSLSLWKRRSISAPSTPPALSDLQLIM